MVKTLSSQCRGHRFNPWSGALVGVPQKLRGVVIHVIHQDLQVGGVGLLGNAIVPGSDGQGVGHLVLIVQLSLGI